MLRFRIVDCSQGDWTEIISEFSDINLLQTWEYGEAKVQTGGWRVQRAVLENANGKMLGAVQAMVRQIPVIGGGLVWINRGPLLQRHDTENYILMLPDALRELRLVWAQAQHMYLRIALPVPEGAVDLAQLRGLEYRPAGCIGWASAEVDLLRPVDELRRKLNQKWRNSLVKAERLGLTAEVGADDLLFETFLSKYEQMLAQRNYHTSVTPALLRHYRDLLPELQKPLILIARQNEQYRGAILLARYGDKCEYLAAAMDDQERTANAGQFLLWNAVLEARIMGYHYFDLGGMDIHRTPRGIYHFKSGLSGQPYRLMEEIEASRTSLVGRLVRRQVRRARKSQESDN